MLHPIIKYLKKPEKLVTGLMSGTSADGIDAALVSVKGSFLNTRIKLINFYSYKYPPKIKNVLHQIINDSESPLELVSEYNFLLGKLFAESALKVIKKAKLKSQDIDLISSHGQTIYHQPPNGFKKTASTFQIASPFVIAQTTQIMTTADFRPADVALGGQGAPLVSYTDWIFFRSKIKNRIILNIGGISNLTYLPKNCSLNQIKAFDTGPGNMLIDELVRIYTKGKLNYDYGGNIAKSGAFKKEILNDLLKNRFIKKTPPKSTGRELFGKKFAMDFLSKYFNHNIKDLIATATVFTAESIFYNIKKFINTTPDEIIISGGGSLNSAIINHLKLKMPKVNFKYSDEFGIPSKAKEAISFAVLGNETLHNLPSNVPVVTGSSRRAVLGSIVLV